MIEQNFGSQQDEDDAAREFGLAFILGAEDVSKLDPRGGKQKGDHADETYGRDDTLDEEGERDADGQRVDAGGDGERQHHPKAHGGALRLFLPGQRLADHVAADEQQQSERNPVIHRGDERFKLRAEEIAEQRHQRLKGAEPQPRDAALLPAGARQRQPLADRHGQRVHRQANGQNDQFPQT